jgi:DNA-binding transcriptional ArsR family regulator
MNIEPHAKTADFVWIALADPTRRAILERLAAGEVRVTDLAAPFDISLNSVSKHIRVLERARLVGRRREGREHFIRADVRPLGPLRAWIERQEEYWKGRLEALDRVLQMEDRRAAPSSRRAIAPQKRAPAGRDMGKSGARKTRRSST